MGCRHDRGGSKATLASTNRSGKAEAGSQFAIVGGSTAAISFSNRYRLLTGTSSASYVGGISRHESFYNESRKTVNPREYPNKRCRLSRCSYTNHPLLLKMKPQPANPTETGEPAKNRQILLSSRPSDEPTLDNFQLAEADIPKPGPAQMLLRTIFPGIRFV